MPLQDKRFQFLNGLAHRVGLTQNVNAVLIFLHHLAYPCHVSLDVRESFQVFLSCNTLLAVSRPKRRKRSELLTTVTDESAIAAAAKIGAFSFNNGINGERIAVGIRTTL